MPRTSTKVCAEAGCPVLVRDGNRCPDHQHARKPQRRRYQPYKTAAWQRTRRRHLQLEPLCRDCGAGPNASHHVDHIDGLGPTGPRGHDHSNLRTLCASCHSTRTAREHPAGWNAP